MATAAENTTESITNALRVFMILTSVRRPRLSDFIFSLLSKLRIRHRPSSHNASAFLDSGFSGRIVSIELPSTKALPRGSGGGNARPNWTTLGQGWARVVTAVSLGSNFFVFSQTRDQDKAMRILVSVRDRRNYAPRQNSRPEKRVKC